MFGYYGYYYSNPYYMIGMILVLIGVVVMLYAQGKVSSSYKRYARVMNARNMTGAQVTREILDSHGLQDVQIKEVSGTMSDHYNPKDRTVSLSTKVYHDASIASLAIASHECGHAIQHKEGYQPLIFRNTILPFCSAGQYLGWIALFIGLLTGNTSVAVIGILGMTGILLFQVATLPVEFDASGRALEILNGSYLTSGEYDGAKKMLSAAAFTYVAAMLSTVLSLLRIVLIVLGNNRD